MQVSEFQLFSVSVFSFLEPFLPKLTAAKRAELENFKAAALWPKE